MLNQNESGNARLSTRTQSAPQLLRNTKGWEGSSCNETHHHGSRELEGTAAFQNICQPPKQPADFLQPTEKERRHHRLGGLAVQEQLVQPLCRRWNATTKISTAQTNLLSILYFFCLVKNEVSNSTLGNVPLANTCKCLLLLDFSVIDLNHSNLICIISYQIAPSSFNSQA